MEVSGIMSLMTTTSPTYKSICWKRSGKKIVLSDGTMEMTFDEFRVYAGVDSTFNIDAAVYKVNTEDRVEFVAYPVREMARRLRERSAHGDCTETTLIDRCPISIRDSDLGD